MVSPAVSKTTTVLVVEDEPFIRLVATMLVEDAGFVVLEAQNADEAIALIEDHPEIDIVFTDVQMAGSMDGLDLVAMAHDRWPPLKFVVVSGDRRPGEVALPEGSRFFMKPYDVAEVGRALHALA